MKFTKRSIKIFIFLIIQTLLLPGISLAKNVDGEISYLSPFLQMESRQLQNCFLDKHNFYLRVENENILRTNDKKSLFDVFDIKDKNFAEWLEARFEILDKNGHKKRYILKDYLELVFSNQFEFPKKQQRLISKIASLSSEELWEQWVSVRDTGTLSDFDNFSDLLDFFAYQPFYFLHYILYVNLMELMDENNTIYREQKYIFLEMMKRWARKSQINLQEYQTTKDVQSFLADFFAENPQHRGAVVAHSDPAVFAQNISQYEKQFPDDKYLSAYKILEPVVLDFSKETPLSNFNEMIIKIVDKLSPRGDQVYIFPVLLKNDLSLENEFEFISLGNNFRYLINQYGSNVSFVVITNASDTLEKFHSANPQFIWEIVAGKRFMYDFVSKTYNSKEQINVPQNIINAGEKDIALSKRRTDKFTSNTMRIEPPELNPVMIKGEPYWELTSPDEMQVRSIALRAPQYQKIDKINSYLLRKYALSVSIWTGFHNTIKDLRNKDHESDLVFLIGFNAIQRKALQLIARKTGIEHKIRFIEEDDIKTVDFLIRNGGDIIDIKNADMPLQVIDRSLITNVNKIEESI
ncbi:MAG: hypothetical protein ABIG64_03720 [Candidatus Omnitrophota bacterium]